MCGIAARFHPVRLPPSPEWHGRADALLTHRGPDAGGWYADERCELVHRRLALIDLSPTGAQPMPNEDGSIQIVFNGEIYNHRELRQTLQRQGHRFRGTSDTEVLVHLYEECGIAMLGQLRGIFAFALYDRDRRAILAARDRFGVKPLFIAQHGEQWLLASEIKAIVALPGFRPQLDRQACYDFLGLGYIPEPATGFANISALPKGTALWVDAHRTETFQYAHVAARPAFSGSMDDAADRAAELLLDAVERQAVADVPVAALLSGGIDSSLVVAAHSRTSAAGSRTFNVRFPDRSYDETRTALDVSRYYATEHQTVDLSDHALTTDSVLDLMRHFDQPFSDMSLVPTYWVSRAVRDRGIICTLSGDGGDEAFGGYPSFWRTNRLVQLMRMPRWARALSASAGSTAVRWTRELGRQISRATTLAEAGQRDSALLLAGLANYLSEKQKQELVLADARESLRSVERLYNGYRPPVATDVEELSRRLTESLFALSLPSDMLRKVDMMSMRASIEVRVPMLDEEVVGLGLSLPHALKTDGRTGKRVLRALASRWLPDDVVRQPKHGFAVPLDVMLPEGFHHRLRELLLGSDARTRPVLDPGTVRHWLHGFAEAREGRSGGAISRGGLYQRVFMVLALELWMREHALSW